MATIGVSDPRAVAQYEFATLRFTWKSATKAPTRQMWTPNTPLGMNKTEARLSFWQCDQAFFNEMVGGICRDGWELISEFGPGAVHIEKYVHKGSGLSVAFGQHLSPEWANVGVEFVFRRPRGSGRESARDFRRRWNREDKEGCIEVIIR